MKCRPCPCQSSSNGNLASKLKIVKFLTATPELPQKNSAGVWTASGHSRRDCRFRSLVRYRKYPTLPTESCVLGASSAGSSAAGQGRKPAEPVARSASLDGLTLSRRLCRQAIMATRLARAHLCWCRRERPGSVWKFAAESSCLPQGVLKLCSGGALVRTAGCAGISQCLPRHWNLLVSPAPTDRAHLARFYPAFERLAFFAAPQRNVA